MSRGKIAGVFLGLVAWFLAAAAPVVAQTDGYRIQPGDRLEVSVLEDPSLNRQVLVRPDGRISLPLAGTLDAAGQSPEALQAAVRARLSREFVEAPTITVSLVALGQPALGEVAAGFASIYVLGQVGSPGRFDVALPIDVLQMLAIAGGPSPFAAGRRIQVRRYVDGVQSVTLFDYELVEDGIVPLARVELADGDVIVVPERGLFE